MNISFEDQIRERAYQMWQAGGMADGQAHVHWTCAEQAVVAERSAEPEIILTKAPARKAAAKTASKTTAKTKAAKPAAKVAAKVTARAPRARAKKSELSAAI